MKTSPLLAVAFITATGSALILGCDNDPNRGVSTPTTTGAVYAMDAGSYGQATTLGNGGASGNVTGTNGNMGTPGAGFGVGAGADTTGAGGATGAGSPASAGANAAGARGSGSGGSVNAGGSGGSRP